MTKAQIIETAKSISADQLAAVEAFFANQVPAQCITRQQNLRWNAIVVHFEEAIAQYGEDEILRADIDMAKAAMA